MLTSFLRNSVLALATVGGLVAAVPAASAGGYGDPEIINADNMRPGRHMERHHWADEVLSEREIVRALRYQGFRNIRSIELRDEHFRVIAIRRNGAVMRLRVDASSGRIINAVNIGWAGYRPMGDDYPDFPRPHHRDGVTFEFGWSSDR